MTTASQSETQRYVFGALALELAPGHAAPAAALTQDAAGTLADRIAQDLAVIVPEAATLELVMVAAHYDPVELLRPGWPLHQRLAQLAARAPGSASLTGGGRLVAFGSHDGQWPDGLAPVAEHAGGALRLLPWALRGEADVLARVGEQFEHALLERGMAGAATALLAQEAFDLKIEHARHLTVHDLTAMTAMQYEHAGLGPLWPLLEAALLAPDNEQWLDAPPEPLLHYCDGEVRIAMLSPHAWQHRYAAADTPADDDDAQAAAALQHRHRQFEARQRQFAAVLGAHGVPVTFVYCDRDSDDHEHLR